MKVYVIFEDWRDEAILNSIWADENKAHAKCKSLNEEHNKRVTNWKKHWKDVYYVEEQEVNE